MYPRTVAVGDSEVRRADRILLIASCRSREARRRHADRGIAKGLGRAVPGRFGHRSGCFRADGSGSAQEVCVYAQPVSLSLVAIAHDSSGKEL